LYDEEEGPRYAEKKFLKKNGNATPPSGSTTSAKLYRKWDAATSTINEDPIWKKKARKR